MKSLIVAQTRKHAEALVKWGKFDTAYWEIALYGESITGMYQSAWVAPPLTEVTEDHAYWAASELKPHVFGPIQTFAKWNLGLKPQLRLPPLRRTETTPEPEPATC